MNIQEYIASGILEDYVLGELSEEQSNEVLKAAQQYPEIKKAITEIEMAMEAMAFSEAVLPPPGLRDTLLSAYNSASAEESEPPIKTIYREKTKSRFSYGIAASVALLITSVTLNFFLYHRLKNEKEKVADLTAEKQMLAGNLKTQEAAYNEANLRYKLSDQNNVTKLSLSGTDNMPEALAKIYWNPGTGNTYLDISKVKPNDKGTSYQLWAIVDGKPVDAGVFSSSDQGHIIAMKTLAAAKDKVQAFAVTIEKEGGSATPTLSKMVLIGKLG